MDFILIFSVPDGIPFYRSVNNVILSPGNSCGYIETKYFSKVIEVSTSKYDRLNSLVCKSVIEFRVTIIRL
jgi:hypothetical protein